MKKKILFFTIPLVVMLKACTYELEDYTPPKVQSFLSFEGEITNLPGVKTFRLFYTNPGLTNSFVSEPVEGAKVWVEDQKGLKVDFKNTETGIYEADFQGIVGNSYQLKMKLKNGRTYASSITKLPAPTDIKAIYAQPSLDESKSIGSPLRGGYDVFVDLKDPVEKNYYRWKWTHYERIIYCAYCRFLPVEREPFFGCDEPTGELREFYLSVFGEKFILNAWLCGPGVKCFDKTESQDYDLLDDVLLNNQLIVQKKIKRIPYVFKTVLPINRYYLLAEQQSLSFETYSAFKALEAQSETNGTLFDVPALTRFSINIKNTPNESEKIIGIFDVHSVSKKLIYVDTSVEIPGAKRIDVNISSRNAPWPPRPVYAGCEKTRNRGKLIPEGWKEDFF